MTIMCFKNHLHSKEEKLTLKLTPHILNGERLYAVPYIQERARISTLTILLK